MEIFHSFSPYEKLILAAGKLPCFLPPASYLPQFFWPIGSTVELPSNLRGTGAFWTPASEGGSSGTSPALSPPSESTRGHPDPGHRLAPPPLFPPGPRASGRGRGPQEVLARRSGRYFRLRYHGRLQPGVRREEAAVREPLAERSGAGLPPQCLVTALPRVRPAARPPPLALGAPPSPWPQPRVPLPSRRSAPRGGAFRGRGPSPPAAGTRGP